MGIPPCHIFEKQPVETVKTNIFGSLNVLELAKKNAELVLEMLKANDEGRFQDELELNEKFDKTAKDVMQLRLDATKQSSQGLHK